MKKIVPEFDFSDEQLNIIKNLSEECGLCLETVKILYGRGIRDKDSIFKFIHPSKSHFISPFKMSGMREAVELITQARAENWSVAVYGDYDADGICAATILGKALKDFGIEPYVCVPERRDGYGLSVHLIDKIFEECFPQLVITVDCGISCAEEVNYIKEQGAEVIVTDHHELPEIIPDCICINPKFEDGYIYDNLCGAGVAFKLGCALNGDDAHKYLDFAAIATVADSVPITGENRDIVYEGLKLINSSPSKCYAGFLNKSESTVNSQNLAFSIAPKINAAGRMGNAKAALTLFNETDENKILDLAAELTAYNLERQQYCDELYKSAKDTLNKCGEIGKVIMLCNEEWNSGFVGIVAARLAEEYCRPVILFVKNGDMLKGSARSIENINIFEALKACKSYIAEFGGHAQAAGVNVTIENFELLHKAMQDYISSAYGKEDFVPTISINGILNGQYSARFAKELEMLEPFGVGNKRPVFLTEGTALSARPVKVGSSHLAVKSDKIDFMYFGGSKYSQLLSSALPKKLIFEYNISVFRGKEYIKGFIRDVIYDSNGANFAADEIAAVGINMLSVQEVDCTKTTITFDEAENLMATCDDFGTVFVAWDYTTITKFKNADNLNVDIFISSSKNNASTILLAPYGVDLSAYSQVVYLDNPCGIRLPSLEGKEIKICENAPVPSYFRNLSCDRNSLLSIFSAFSANEKNIAGTSIEEIAVNNPAGVSVPQALFALKVFEQLSLIYFDDGGSFCVRRGIKTDLTNSQIYNTVLKLQTE